MSFLQFVVAIVSPGVQVSDIVNAAVTHSVHIIDRHEYDPAQDYVAQSKMYQPFVNDERISLLFVLDGRTSILADSDAHLKDALDLFASKAANRPEVC